MCLMTWNGEMDYWVTEESMVVNLDEENGLSDSLLFSYLQQ